MKWLRTKWRPDTKRSITKHCRVPWCHCKYKNSHPRKQKRWRCLSINVLRDDWIRHWRRGLSQLYVIFSQQTTFIANLNRQTATFFICLPSVTNKTKLQNVHPFLSFIFHHVKMTFSYMFQKYVFYSFLFLTIIWYSIYNNFTIFILNYLHIGVFVYLTT